jgi:hypothetical protein
MPFGFWTPGLHNEAGSRSGTFLEKQDVISQNKIFEILAGLFWFKEKLTTYISLAGIFSRLHAYDRKIQTAR